MRRITALVGALVMLVVAAPSTSAAQAAHHATATSTGALPFTGLDLVLLGVGGAALVAAGLLARRMAGRPG